jgi:hypothetical protein
MAPSTQPSIQRLSEARLPSQRGALAGQGKRTTERCEAPCSNGTSLSPAASTRTLLRDGTVLLSLDMLRRVEPRLDKDTDSNVLVVAEEPKVPELGGTVGLRVEDAATLRALANEICQREVAERAKAAAAATSPRIRERRQSISTVSALVFAGVGVLAWDHIEEIVRTATVWGSLAALVILGTCLYALRGRFRLTYGVAELTIGFLTAAKVFAPTFNFGTVGWRDLLSILAGLYVVVRGLDNVGKALEATSYESAWRRFSGEVRKQA